MAYATLVDYTEVYVGQETIDDSEFATLAERASDIIDEVTLGSIQRVGFDNMSAEQKKAVKKAVCAQIDHLYLQGIENAISGGSTGSYNIGKTTITRGVGTSGATSTGASARVSPLVKGYLFNVGLLYRGVDYCLHLNAQ